ncbi:MAG: hypothetical protein IKK49_08865 [Clostridia bacterium]|nr:hypothetical protein [Clostridia bacterium]MBQ7101388.1 hypothetical protein [Clostridia bacterium]MBR3755187.1 hypothetical protein [Clostridia bacterium]
MTEKSLDRLADEYSETIKIIDEQIEACRADIRRAKLGRRNFILDNLNRKLSVLYDQRNELAQTQAHLRHYYDSEELRYAV